MKKVLTIAFLAMVASTPSVISASATQQATEEQQEKEFVRFDYMDIALDVPSGCQISMTTKEATLENDDSSFGFNLQLKKDKNATDAGAVELCRGTAEGMGIGTNVQEVEIGGFRGAKVSGTSEGAEVSVVSLNSGAGKYIVMVVVNAPGLSSWADKCINSIRKP